MKGASECVMGKVVRRSLGFFAGEEEKKRWSAPMSMGERGDEVNTSSDCHVALVGKG